MSELDPVTVAIQQIRQVEPGMTKEYIEGQLSDDQHAVLAALKDGKKTLTDAAESAGVSRSTVYRWLESDPFFIASYNAWKAELNASVDVKLSHLTDPAVAALEKALTSGDAKIAYKFLKDRGHLVKQKSGGTDPGLVRQQLAADIQRESPLTGPDALTALLTQAGLSREQQRALLILTLRSHRPARALGAR